jgi:hypothetical protein
VGKVNFFAQGNKEDVLAFLNLLRWIHEAKIEIIKQVGVSIVYLDADLKDNIVSGNLHMIDLKDGPIKVIKK